VQAGGATWLKPNSGESCGKALGACSGARNVSGTITRAAGIVFCGSRPFNRSHNRVCAAGRRRGCLAVPRAELAAVFTGRGSVVNSDSRHLSSTHQWLRTPALELAGISSFGPVAFAAGSPGARSLADLYRCHIETSARVAETFNRCPVNRPGSAGSVFCTWFPVEVDRRRLDLSIHDAGAGRGVGIPGSNSVLVESRVSQIVEFGWRAMRLGARDHRGAVCRRQRSRRRGCAASSALRPACWDPPTADESCVGMGSRAH
jgi:hypothetical protein